MNAALVREAIAFLRRTSLPIEPRKKWPDGGMPQYGVQGTHLRQSIGRSQAGRLCVWGDAGWGSLVGKASTAMAIFPMTSLRRA